MTHIRKRFVYDKLLKRLKHFPVVAVQGARQTGKSFLVNKIYSKTNDKALYRSFDQQTWLNLAQKQPHTFLQQESALPLIIDEAQKVPNIFDAIKYEVDQNRIAGKFLLLGSTEFSHLTKIRESLTGRLGRIRVFPMNLQESLGHHLKKKPSRAQVVQYLRSGGMPAGFAIRDKEAQTSYFEDWVQLTCYRDIHQVRKFKLESELAFKILNSCATLYEPTRSQIAKKLKVDSRKIETHLKALCEIFVLQKILPHDSSSGQPFYFLLDTGIANYLGADQQRCLQIFLMNERLSKNHYFDSKQKQFYYYRSSSYKHIDLIEVTIEGHIFAMQVMTDERINARDVQLMKIFIQNNKNTQGKIFAPIPESHKLDGVEISPWENIIL